MAQKVNFISVADAIPISWLEDFRDGLDTLSESRLMLAIDLIIDAYRVEKKREENEKNICNNGTYHAADRM